MKRIPKSFQMGPHTIHVEIVSEEEMFKANDREGTVDTTPYGLTKFVEARIYIQKARKGFPKQMQMHTFWHEYMHMLLYHAGRERLSRDERLVDACGALQLQALQTFQF